MVNFIDLFAGCGGLSKGLELVGFECVGFVEFWQPAINTYLNNCKGELIGKDITQISDVQISKFKGKIDVVCGGPPCQGFSMAGKRNVNDPRNRLFLDFVRFIKVIEPKYFIMENVSAIGTIKNPEGELVLKEILRCFKEIGYETEVKVLDSSNYQVPQKRKRAIFIGNNQGKENKYPGFKGKIFLKEVLNLPYEQDPTIQHILEKVRKKKNYIYSYIEEGKNYGLFKSTFKKLRMNGFACTITKSGRYIHPEFNRIITVREAARIQSFSDKFEFSGTVRQMYMQIGNAVPVMMAKAIGEVIKEELENVYG